MGAGHAHVLYVHEHSPVHRLVPQTKIVGTVVFVVAVAITPRQAILAFAVHAILLGSTVALSRIPFRFFLTRLVALFPFILFALFLPIIGGGDRVVVLGFELSVQGLWAAWGIVAKALLGGGASIVLVATTEVPEILRGLTRLRVPAVLVAIAGFMVRYTELIVEELGRMRKAMTARGHDPRWLWQTRPIAAGAGALFIRSYERGERVHGAMLARGFNGRLPEMGLVRGDGAAWAAALVIPVIALASAVASLVYR
ncbi:MAG: cobalt ECF transporter T component CbiQ [Actinobacteria bacterium]|nr:cobalt ECF transporter T component CbiQ [Actinomycetota bacterium]